MPRFSGYGRRRRFRRTGRRLRRRTRRMRFGRRRTRMIPYGFTGSRAELKYVDSEFSFDIESTSASFAGTDYAVSLVPIPSGAGISQRIGRQIIVKKIQVNVAWKWNTGNTDVGADDGGEFRFLLVQDRMSNGTSMTNTQVITALLQDTGHPTTSFLNLANRNRFKVLKDKIIPVTPTNGNAGSGVIRVVKKKRIRVTYNNDAAPGSQAVTDIQSNNIFMLFIPGLTLTSNSAVTVTHNRRVRYIDV